MSAKMLPQHQRVLTALDEGTQPHGEYCAHFKTICRDAKIDDVRIVRRITRHLARKGFAEYHRALWTDDGEPAGAGYCITHAGKVALAAITLPTPSTSTNSGDE